MSEELREEMMMREAEASASLAMSEELKPCPFCGGNLIYTEPLPKWRKRHCFDCENCGANIYFFACDKEEAIKKLSTRPESKSENDFVASSKLVEAARNMSEAFQRLMKVEQSDGIKGELFEARADMVAKNRALAAALKEAKGVE